MISSRFSVAIHILALIDIHDGKVTSDFIASSVNTNAAVIRRIMGMLSRANLIASNRGIAGIKLLRPIKDITFLDVYHAVELPEQNDLFTVHQDTNEKCLVGRNIQPAIESPLREAQRQMELVLGRTKIDGIIEEIKSRE